jgi:hypothetical protein
MPWSLSFLENLRMNGLASDDKSMREIWNVYTNLLVEKHEEKKLLGEHVTPYNLVEILPRVNGTYCYHLQGRTCKKQAASNQTKVMGLNSSRLFLAIVNIHTERRGISVLTDDLVRNKILEFTMQSRCSLLLAGCLFGSLFDPEDRRNTFRSYHQTVLFIITAYET